MTKDKIDEKWQNKYQYWEFWGREWDLTGPQTCRVACDTRRERKRPRTGRMDKVVPVQKWGPDLKMDVHLHSLLNSVLQGSKWTDSRSGRLYQRWQTYLFKTRQKIDNLSGTRTFLSISSISTQNVLSLARDIWPVVLTWLQYLGEG